MIDPIISLRIIAHTPPLRDNVGLETGDDVYDFGASSGPPSIRRSSGCVIAKRASDRCHSDRGAQSPHDVEHAFERAHHGLSANSLAIARKSMRLGNRFRVSERPGHAHGADRLFSSASPRAGSAADGNGDVGMARCKRARGHLFHRLLRYGAVPLEGLRADAEHFRFGDIRIGDESAVEPERAARDHGYRLAYPAART